MDDEWYYPSRQTDSSQTFHFDTVEDFEEFVNPQKDKK